MTALIIAHPMAFDANARLRLATRKMDLALSTYMKQYNWEPEMDRIYREACEAEDRSIALLNEAKYD